MIGIGLGLNKFFVNPYRSNEEDEPSGTYEVTVQTFGNGSYYNTGFSNPCLYLLISKTSSERWIFRMEFPDSGAPDVDGSQYTNVASVSIDVGWSSAEVATAMYNAAISAGFDVTISDSTLTFTASQTGDLTDAIGDPSPTITNGS